MFFLLLDSDKLEDMSLSATFGWLPTHPISGYAPWGRCLHRLGASDHINDCLEQPGVLPVSLNVCMKKKNVSSMFIGNCIYRLTEAVG
jgi:hypothetical protein